MKAVIFDMDGLMFDTERLYMAAWDYAGEQLGLGKCGYMVIKTLGMTSDQCYAAWAREFGSRFDKQQVRALSHAYQDAYLAHQNVPEKPGLHTLLNWLREKQIPQAVASSSHAHEIDRYLDGAGIRDRFSVIVSGDEVAHSKPDPEIYRTACARLGFAPQDCVALEDSRNGLLSAHAAGCRALMVPDLWQPDDTVLGFIEGPFADLAQVRDYLARAEDQ